MFFGLTEMMSPRNLSTLRSTSVPSEQPSAARPAVFAPDQAPRVWVLSSPRAGERTQLLGLAESLGCPFEIKHIAHRPFGAALELLGGEHVHGIDRERSDALEAPWPDLVLLAHQSNENVARWIRRQSGGRTRLVLLGRPWAPIDEFDLVVTTPQYELPEAANVLHNPLPLHRVSAERLAADGAKWQPRVAHLPRPYAVPGYPYTPAIVLLSGIGFLIGALLSDTSNSLKAAGFLALCLPVYALLLRNRAQRT